jgi:hypothetical protein
VKPVLRLRLLASATLTFTLSIGLSSAAATAPGDRPEYSTAEIRQLARDAHTVQQFSALADYYQTRRRMYQRMAAHEMHLWAERNAVMTPLSEKWPRPVDAARNLYEYYLQMADESASLVERYNKLADAAPYQ